MSHSCRSHQVHMPEIVLCAWHSPATRAIHHPLCGACMPSASTLAWARCSGYPSPDPDLNPKPDPNHNPTTFPTHHPCLQTKAQTEKEYRLENLFSEALTLTLIDLTLNLNQNTSSSTLTLTLTLTLALTLTLISSIQYPQ